MSEPEDCREPEFRLGKLFSRSKRMGQIFSLIEDLSHSDAPVLFWGETGTGKTELALSLHEASNLRKFVLLPCLGLAADKIRGAIIGEGSPGNPLGAIREANKGTLALLNVDEMSLEAQSALVGCISGRAVVSRQFRSVIGARIVSTSRQDLLRRVRSGHFREDLLYRLTGATIAVPALRERREDIGWLADSFLGAAAARYPNRTSPKFSPDAREFLLGYAWRGNLRQLQSVMALVAERTRGHTVTHHALAEFMVAVAEPPAIHIPIGSTLAHAERLVIRETLASHGGNRQATANTLAISRRTLYEKLRSYREQEP